MHRCLSVLITLVFVASACGDDGDGEAAVDESMTTTTAEPGTETVDESTTSTTTTTPATTGTAPTLTAADLTGDGPYEVGVTTRELPTGNLVEIWYPAAPEADGITETYQVRTFIGPILEPLVAASDIDDSYSVEAARDASPASDGPFPVVLFSRGFAGFRLQSTNLTRHLASWGMVVASPDHPTRELSGQLGPPAENPPDSADDLRAALALLGDSADDSVLDGVADIDRVGLGGHSAGGGTILAVAGDEGIDGYVSYASGASEDTALPDVPSLFMAGRLDTVIEAGRTRAAWERAPSPSWFWDIDAAGHLAFSDLCAVGGGEANLLDLAVVAGIGDLVPENLERLATDGCDEPNLPVELVFPAINQASAGFYRWIFGIDDEPIGLDGTDTTDVRVQSR